MLRKSDIPGNITHDVVSSVIDDINDECPGRVGCMKNDECDAGGKHFSRGEKSVIIATSVIWVPLLIVADIINVGILPFKIGYRVYDKCTEY